MFKSMQKRIAEIHHEFDTAEDRLLDQAKKIIQNSSIPKHQQLVDLAQRHIAVGFKNTQTVKKANEVGQKKLLVVKSKEEADLILYYKQKYPFQKFLTIDELNRICKKYGLIYAAVANYVGELPEKNLKDIEGMPHLLAADEQSTQYIIRYTGGLSGWLSDEAQQLYRKGITLFERPSIALLSNIFNSKTGLTAHMYQSLHWEMDTVDREGLFIAAPRGDFKLKGLKNKGLGFFSISTLKDPIVFRYCRGGIQVITKWGLEASDESLLNEKQN
jgi:hypothetical protein